MSPSPAYLGAWSICALATAGVIARPFRAPEAVWAVLGAGLLVALGLLPWREAWRAVGEGSDVYLFLAGMMLLSETARLHGLFDAAAALAVNAAKGSTARLFSLVYGVGVVVTVFLSNDATAVVLTPAVYGVARKAGIEPLPLLFACAMVANAASFVLPISNPANLVLYASRTPPLLQWLARFGLPSALAIMATWAALRWAERRALAAPCASRTPQPRLTRGGWIALAGIVLTALGLTTASALGLTLGLPTALLGVLTALAVLTVERAPPWPLLRGVAWSVLPLVAGLFILVQALVHTGVVTGLAQALHAAQGRAEDAAAAAVGSGLALAVNLMNNLPAGLVASAALTQAHAPPRIVDAALIAVDLGPNLSVTGSLATVLWLSALRREGEQVSFGRFLKVGVLVMPPALLLALAARLIGGG
jgi:arsenical pump membrane protein